VSKLAQLIAKREGFGIAGDIPTTHNNPGDLEHAPGEMHDTGSPIGEFLTVEDGWEALENQLQKYADRGLTVQDMIEVYAPPTENDTDEYLDFICEGLGCQPNTLVKDALLIK
jgi:hypothetical protein